MDSDSLTFFGFVGDLAALEHGDMSGLVDSVDLPEDIVNEITAEFARYHQKDEDWLKKAQTSDACIQVRLGRKISPVSIQEGTSAACMKCCNARRPCFRLVSHRLITLPVPQLLRGDLLRRSDRDYWVRPEGSKRVDSALFTKK